ncbi:MAG: ATP-dependent RNA helicase HrpA [Proteobacteria bacterium]|nr:ATP-dependent RNA helicase HrpA [Pseudomonadota bacterium]
MTAVKPPHRPPPVLTTLLDETVLAERRGLARALERLGAHADDAALAAWRTHVDAARARYAARAANVPPIRIDESLPIAAKADEIVRLIREHQVLVLAGETGSGKSTQLPKLCLAAGRGVAGLIGCTQPRRVAARSVARRVAAELGTELGSLVGYQVRFAEKASERTLVKFMTDGILLAETQSDPWLNAYDTIILDEAHERSLNIDFLLGYLKRLLARRRDLKLIVTSATIDTSLFARHFDTAPVIEVEGRGYPVEVRWRPIEMFAANGRGTRPSPAKRERGEPSADADGGVRAVARIELNVAEQIAAALDEITAEDPRGDVLVFLPGEREIRDAHLALTRRRYRSTDVLALYARLSAAEQDRVFKPGAGRRIVLATNVAETSLTVPRIKYVVDTGTARVKRYSPRNQLERLHIEPISQAAADQRKGRCGRVGPGICVRLYSEEDFAARARYSDPEILRSSLAGVILRMLSLKLGEVEKFPFVEAPDARAINDGWRRLFELQAVDADKRLTPTGREMARWPIDVALARMLIEAQRKDALREMLILAAFLSIQDPRERPADARQAADAAHAQWADPKSDFIGVLNLWHAHASAHEELTQSKLRDWCRERFLSYLRMREWRELHRQLLLIGGESEGPTPTSPSPPLRAMGERAGVRGRRSGISATSNPLGMSPPHPTLSPNTVGGEGLSYEAIHRCLLAGWPTQVGRRDERGEYRGTRERKFRVFPGSALAKAPPQWLLAGQIIDLQKVYAMSCARIEPEWVEQQAAHLVKKSWRDPHWSRKRGAVLAFEQVTLFGLTLVEKRSVAFATQDPAAAHEVFMREALVRGDIDCRADCVRANARVLAQAQELEAKQRRSGLIRGEDELAAFFSGKLPADISTAAAFDAWYRRAPAAEQAAMRWSLDDVLASTPGLRASDFPATMAFAGHRLKLEYRFVPGDAADGVTLQVPLAFVNAVSALSCDWLVPGLLADKVAELIRGLPKSLRRNFVPAPDFARAFAQAEAPRDESVIKALAGYLQRVTGVEVSERDFAAIELPAHLAMRFRVHDEQGKTLAEGRDIDALRGEWGAAANAAFSRHADVELAREDVAEFDFDEISPVVTGAGGVAAYPALVDLGESVALRVFERADEARDAHAGGVEHLLRRALRETIKQARRQLPIERKLALKYAGIASVDELRDDIVEAALADLLAARDLDVRTREAFRSTTNELARELFPAAVERLKIVEEVLSAYAELSPWLEPPLMGYARANYDDLREQLDALVHPGFVRDVEKSRLAHFPRYLKAMRLRAERLRQDAARDQAKMLTVRVYWSDYLKLVATHGAHDTALAELRWLIEELRVSLFAQELKTAEPVSPKRLAKLVEGLKAS